MLTIMLEFHSVRRLTKQSFIYLTGSITFHSIYPSTDRPTNLLPSPSFFFNDKASQEKCTFCMSKIKFIFHTQAYMQSLSKKMYCLLHVWSGCESRAVSSSPYLYIFLSFSVYHHYFIQDNVDCWWFVEHLKFYKYM